MIVFTFGLIHIDRVWGLFLIPVGFYNQANEGHAEGMFKLFSLKEKVFFG